MSDYDEMNAAMAREAQRKEIQAIKRWELALAGGLAVGALALVSVAAYFTLTGHLPGGV